MRKLRRLPWRIPKSHNDGPPSRRETANHDNRRRAEPVREPVEREAPTQPVAFTAGRYVYGCAASSTPANTEIRRKVRHRVATLPHLAST